MRRADRDRHAGGDHAVGAQHADGEVGDVHRAALAAVVSGRAAEQLGHHALHVGALGQRVAVAAVGGRQQVVALQIGADAGGNGFLPGRQVQRPAHGAGWPCARPEGGHAALAGDLGRVLEGADARHRAIQRKQALRRAVVVHAALSPSFWCEGRILPSYLSFCSAGCGAAVSVASERERHLLHQRTWQPHARRAVAVRAGVEDELRLRVSSSRFAPSRRYSVSSKRMHVQRARRSCRSPPRTSRSASCR